ncbi:MAG TPA: alpha/beta hydrolase-fold protein [Thermoanaerobaculia bacterium]|nr:alpha/beta hydrolase-fold protein [Thermoanaerobaculia bacterium]
MNDLAAVVDVHPSAADAIPGLHPTLRAGKVNLLGPFEVPGLQPRLVRLYLPKEYRRQEEPRLVLYMFDGQNMFDDAPSFSGGWHIDEAVERLARTRRPVPVVVGIDHAGPRRIRELSPFPFEGEPGQIESLLDWLTGELMPALAAELHLATGPLGAIVGGSSMGGLAALYAHFRHPEAFGGALSMSPSLWIGQRAIFQWIAAQPLPPVSRIYLDCGAREGRGSVLPMVAAMAALLSDRGYDADRLVWRPDPRGVHNEASWRRRLPKALRFLYGPGETGAPSARSGGVIPRPRV